MRTRRVTVRYIFLFGLVAAAIVGGQLLRRQRDLMASDPVRVAPVPANENGMPVGVPRLVNSVNTDLGTASADKHLSETITPRDSTEWQGMLIEPSTLQEECDGPTSCGMAMACKNRRCLPCKEDTDCAFGESCAIQHCVLTSKTDCRSRSDCSDPEDVCALSGYSSDPRGNSQMTATCLGKSGGAARTGEDRSYRSTQLQPGRPPAMRENELRDGL